MSIPLIWLVVRVFIVSLVMVNTVNTVSTPMIWLVFFVLVVSTVMMNPYIP